MAKTKQKSSAGKSVLVFFIVFIILEMLIVLGVGKVFKNKDVTPSVAGYSLYLMDSKNMGDAVPKGSLVVASNGIPGVDKVGKAVLCENVPGIGTGVFRLQDVVSKAEGVDGVVYRIYEQNIPEKIYEVKSSDIIGIASNYYVTTGKVITFLKSKFGIIACAAVPVVLLIIIELIVAIATHSSSSKKKKKNEKIEENKDDENKEVKLDDFLFGGKNEGEQIAKHRQKIEEEIAEHHNAENDDDTDETADDYAQSEKSEPVVLQDNAEVNEDDNAEAEKQPKAAVEASASSADIDRTYYEKASELLDKPVEENGKEEISEPVAETKERAPKPDKPAQASLEELMKLMEEEQNKLKKQLQDK